MLMQINEELTGIKARLRTGNKCYCVIIKITNDVKKFVAFDRRTRHSIVFRLNEKHNFIQLL